VATETHRTTTKRGVSVTHITSNNPKRNNTVIAKPTAPPKAGNWGGSGVRTQYNSVKTGNRVSRSGANLGTSPSGRRLTSKLVGDVAKATPAGRAAKIGSKVSGFSLPKSDKRTSSALGQAVNHSPVLLSEFLVAMVIVGAKGVTDIATTGYQKAITGIMLRYTAIIAIWFVLFLMSSSKRGSQFAMWFGLLIDLGILFDAVSGDAIANLTSIINGQGLPSQTVLLGDKDQKPTEYYSTGETTIVKPTSATTEAL
jgi:hypothetical protein